MIQFHIVFVVFCKHGVVAVGSREACNMGKLY